MFEKLWRQGQDYINALGPAGLALNLGLSTVLIFAAAVGSWALSWALTKVFRYVAGDGDAGKKRSLSGLSNFGKALHGAVWICAVVLVLSVWGVNFASWAGGAGAPILAVAMRVLVIAAVAALAWELAIRAIEKSLYRAADRAETRRRAAQLRSIAPMARSAARATIAVFAGLMILSQFGVQVGPLLAGAGVVGVAIGFGAQTLVKDYLTGFSLIIEDIVSVGDIVQIGDHGGLVETMTLRTIRLRDFDGTLHIIPYSEAQIVHNRTKTFSYYVFDIPISYDADIDLALEIMRQTGDELRADPAYADKIIDPIEVVGVDSLADSAVVLKARIKTAPLQQWNVGRQYNRRIKLAFDAAGVEIPVPHLKLLLSDRALAAVKNH